MDQQELYENVDKSKRKKVSFHLVILNMTNNCVHIKIYHTVRTVSKSNRV